MRVDARKSRLGLALLIAAQAGFAGVAAQEAVDEAAAAGPTVAERLERIENALANQGLLEMVQQLQTLEMELNRLRGEMEVNNHTLEQLKKRQRDLYTDIDRRMQRLENPLAAAPDGAEPPLQTLSPFAEAETPGAQQGVTPLTLELVDQEPSPGAAGADAAPLSALPEQAQALTPGLPSELATLETPETAGGFAQELATYETGAALVQAAPPAAAAPASADDTALPAAQNITAPATDDSIVPATPEQIAAEYERAFNLLKQSRYELAVTAFREFLARHPASAQAANARFWLAEAYYVNSLFEPALAEYLALLQQYPASAKATQAKLKAAFCEHELGRTESAKAQLEEIVQLYPGTAAANLAQERLSAIATAAAVAEEAPGAEPENR